VEASAANACPHRIISSAKRREWMGGQPGPKLMPERFLFCSSVCKRIDNSLIAMTKRYGDRGQP